MRIVRNNGEKGNVFDKHFRELRNVETPPPGDLWDRVEYNLDEDRKRKKHDHWYYAALLLLIPLTLVNIYLTYDLSGIYSSVFKNSGTPASTEAVRQEMSVLDETLAPTADSRRPVFKQEPAPTPLFPGNSTGANGGNNTGARNSSPFAPAIDAAYLVNSPAANTAEDGSGNSLTGEAGAIELNNRIPAERLLLETDITPQDVKFTQARNENFRKQSAVRGFHVGVEGGVHNSMILLKENTLSPIVGDKIHRKVDPAAYYAVSMGYDFSRKFGMETEFIFRSHAGQKFTELRYGKIPIEGDIDLEYIHVPLLFKYKMTKLGGKGLHPRVVNLVAGIQYSRLKNAEVDVNNIDLKNVTAPFNRDELGLVLGVEYDCFVHENYFLTLGTRASISSDLKAFPLFVPQASQTYNVLVGVNASFHYLMKRR